MLGNHRDAWTYGAVDPSSGTSATLETCRALGEAKKSGWSPRRTIMYTNWDAEEYGLVGSTEWAEEHEKEIAEKAVLMLNVDSAVSGPDLSAGGIPSLRDLFLSAASDVTNPRTGKTLASEWLEAQRKEWANQPIDLDSAVWLGTNSDQKPPEFVPQMSFLGSGSDYTAFVDHLGVPALNVSFSGRYGVYHSIYDDFYWMEKFGDPEFLQHATAAKLYALMILRASSAEVVPSPSPPTPTPSANTSTTSAAPPPARNAQPANPSLSPASKTSSPPSNGSTTRPAPSTAKPPTSPIEAT